VGIIGKEIDITFWLKMAVAVLIVLLMPIWSFTNSTSFNMGAPTLYFSYTCFLFNYQNASDWLEPEYWIRDTPSVVAGLIVCIPAIYFNRRLSREREGRSVWELGAAVFFSTASIAAYLVYSFPPMEIAAFAPDLDWDLLSFASVVLLFLVLFPVFAREASHLGAERSAISTVKSRSRRRRFNLRPSASTIYSILGYAIGLATCLLPFFLIVNVWGPNNHALDTISVLAPMNYRHYQTDLGWAFIETRFEIPELMPMVDVLVFSGFRTLFGYSVIRHCRGRASRRRTLSYGIAGVLIPLVYFQFVQGPYTISDITYFIPLPIVFIVGLLVIRFVTPLEPKLLPQIPRTEEVVLPERRRNDGHGEYVRVPLLYSIGSRMRGATARLKDSRRGSGSSTRHRDETREESSEREVRDSE
jgi:hypothetical protein